MNTFNRINGYEHVNKVSGSGIKIILGKALINYLILQETL